MRNLRILAALGLIAAAGAAQADVSGTVTLATDYDFRGFSQTGEDPAIQGSIDYSNESGFYAGTWASNIGHFSDGGEGTASTELDVYAGFKGTAGSVGWDAGIVYYTYSGASDLNYPEIYVKGTVGFFTGSVYYSNQFGGTYFNGESWEDTDDAFYVSADAAIPAGELTVNLHAGFSDGDGLEQVYFGDEDSYADYSAGISYSASNVTIGLKYVIRDSDSKVGYGSDDRIILSVSTALPWK
jgi:uncharacterized protein (TIGR02001 family)